MSAFTSICQRIANADVPVLRQEMRVRQRGGKAFGIMLGYVAILSIIAIITLFKADLSANRSFQYGPSSTMAMAIVGRDMFAGLTFAQLVMVLLVVPAYSAGVVTMEREKGSFDLLVLTALSSSGIVTQKFAAALAQTIMLMVASIPVLAIVFLLGGVSPVEVLIAYLILFATTAGVGGLGVMFSCYLKNTRTATLLTYLFTFLFLAGMPIAGEIIDSYSRSGYQSGELSYVLGITLGVAFAAGIIAIFVFGIVALILSRNTERWKSRVYRMWVFGGSYAAVLLVFNTPSLCSAIINATQINGMFAPLFVNAFVAIGSLVSLGGLGSSPDRSLIISLTILFSLGCAYLFRHLSITRFHSIRRT